MAKQEPKQKQKRTNKIPMYDDALLEAQQDEREMRDIYERQQRWSSYPV